jgi:hypothetical protein
VDDILDLRQHFSVVQHDDQPLLAMVNRVGLPWATLPTLLSFSHLHAFWNGGPGMIVMPTHPKWRSPMLINKSTL